MTQFMVAFYACRRRLGQGRFHTPDGFEKLLSLRANMVSRPIEEALERIFIGLRARKTFSATRTNGKSIANASARRLAGDLHLHRRPCSDVIAFKEQLAT